MRKTTVIFGLMFLVVAQQLLAGCNKPPDPNSTTGQNKVAATASQSQNINEGLDSSASKPPETASFSGHPWPTVGQNNQRTSCSPLPGPDNPELKWSVQLTGDNGNYRYGLNRSPLVAQGNTVYVQVAMAIINAVDADGRFLWSRKTDLSYYQPSITSDGNLLFATDKVVLLNSLTGASRTIYGVGPGIPFINSTETLISIPISVSADLMLFAKTVSTSSLVQKLNSYQIQMIALDGNYNNLFSTDIPDFPMEHIAAAVDGAVFIPGINQLTALDQSGQIQWIYTIQGTGMKIRPVVSQSTGLILYDRMGPVKALDMSGKLQWEIDYSPLRVYHVAVDHQDNLIVFLGSKLGDPPVFSRAFVKLDPQGHEIWRKEFSFQSALSVSIDSDDNIYFSSDEGVYSLNSDGSDRWKLDIPDCTGQVVIGEDNTLFVLTKGGKLHCIGEVD